MLLWTAWSSKQEQGPDSLIIPVQEPNCFHDALRLTTFIRYEHQLAGLERTQASRTVWVEYLNSVCLEQNRKIVGLEWTLKFPVLHHYTRRSSPHLYPPPPLRLLHYAWRSCLHFNPVLRYARRSWLCQAFLASF